VCAPDLLVAIDSPARRLPCTLTSKSVPPGLRDASRRRRSSAHSAFVTRERRVVDIVASDSRATAMRAAVCSPSGNPVASSRRGALLCQRAAAMGASCLTDHRSAAPKSPHHGSVCGQPGVHGPRRTLRARDRAAARFARSGEFRYIVRVGAPPLQLVRVRTVSRRRMNTLPTDAPSVACHVSSYGVARSRAVRRARSRNSSPDRALTDAESPGRAVRLR